MDKVQLARDAVEYLSFTFTGLPTDGTFVLEAQFGGAGSWHALDRTTGTPRLLVCGPDVPVGSQGGAVVIAAAGAIRIRVRDTPQIIPRGAGYLALVS